MRGRKKLRNVCGPVIEKGVWRIRVDQKLSKLCKTTVVSETIKGKSLDWFVFVITVGMH
jgi:hypothetical protein